MPEGSSFHKGVKEVQPPTEVLRMTYKRSIAWALAGAGVALVVFVASLALGSRVGNGLAFLLPFAGIAFAVLALVHLRSLLLLRAPLVIPARCPPPLPHLRDVSSAIQEGLLPVYDQAPDLMRRVRRLRGGRLGWGTRASQGAAQRVLGSIGPTAVAIAGLLLAGLTGFALGTTAGVMGLVVALGGGAALTFWSYRSYREVENLFPAQDPSTTTLERIETVRGGGDPFVLRSEVEQRLMSMRVQGLPNRTLSEGWTVPVETLQNAGRVSGDMVVETHPEHVPEGADPSAARFGDLALLPLQVATLAPLFLFPAFGVGAGLAALVLLVSCLAACHAGIGHGVTVANRFRWRSTLVYVHLEGSVGRSEIRAGRGHTDSFESSNTVVRSDCQVRVYTATLLSESLAVDGPRDLIALSQEGNAHQAMEEVLVAVRSFESSGVRIRSIDLQDAGLEHTARANLAMDAERSRITSAVVRDSLQQPDAPGAPHLAGAVGPDGPLLGFSDARVQASEPGDAEPETHPHQPPLGAAEAGQPDAPAPSRVLAREE